MSWVIRSSASRVLPTRVVPSTRVCPTRSPMSIQTSCSSGSTACRAGLPPTAGKGRRGFHQTRLLKQVRDGVQARNRLPLDLLAACPLVEGSRLDIVLHLRADGVAQALGVLLGPAEAPAQEELAPTEWDAIGAQPIGREPAHVALVAQGSKA